WKTQIARWKTLTARWETQIPHLDLVIPFLTQIRSCLISLQPKWPKPCLRLKPLFQNLSPSPSELSWM
ncbi:hypothetical protein U1Q18_031348, partial [Sarracenia purpurea var. burkii]